ncbi:hypothetical protein ACP4OV_001365 [Aristida adscensionis]
MQRNVVRSPAAMASRLLLCLLFWGYCAIVSGINSGSKKHGFAVVPTSFASEPACFADSSPAVASDPNRVSVPLTHRHGPCTPSGTSGQPPLAERLRRDRARTSYIVSRVSGGRASTRLSDGGGVIRIPTYADYVVMVGLGTPAVKQSLLMDNGCDLSWVQCTPCNATSSCYPRKNPVFDPRKSSTYAPIPCDTDACRGLTDCFKDGCTNSTRPSLCRCGIEYSVSDGLYSMETLTLNPGVSQGTFDKYDDNGFLLSGGPESIVSQTAGLYGGAFSYCMPPGNGTAGFLTLGVPRNNTAGFVFAPLQNSTCYVVTLAGISVAGKPLSIPPAVLSGGMVIDSIMEITVLPPTAYTALRTAFRSAMSMYPLLPPNKDYVYDGDLDTCYNFTGFSNVTVPTVSLSFSGGATIDIDPSGVLLEGCLAFADGVRDGGRNHWHREPAHL